MRDVNVVILGFNNCKGKEFVTENEDGSYTIFINAKLCQEQQMKAYRHAMQHIRGGDFKKTDVQQIEYIAHYDDK